MNKEKKITTIVVEDQIVSWDYINSVLKEHAEVKSFCKNSFEAEAAFLKFKPDLIWLDCYLGEISLDNQGLKNSGLELANWIKGNKPKTYNRDLIALLSGYFECSCKQAEDYLDILSKKELKF